MSYDLLYLSLVLTIIFTPVISTRSIVCDNFNKRLIVYLVVFCLTFLMNAGILFILEFFDIIDSGDIIDWWR